MSMNFNVIEDGEEPTKIDATKGPVVVLTEKDGKLEECYGVSARLGLQSIARGEKLLEKHKIFPSNDEFFNEVFPTSDRKDMKIAIVSQLPISVQASHVDNFFRSMVESEDVLVSDRKFADDVRNAHGDYFSKDVSKEYSKIFKEKENELPSTVDFETSSNNDLSGNKRPSADISKDGTGSDGENDGNPEGGSNIPTRDTTREDEIVNMIYLMGEATEYEGFSPQKVRVAFIKKFDNEFEYFKMLSFAFTAYARIGNNTGKLSIKRRNLNMVKGLVSSLNTIGISRTAHDSQSLTLPRLAIAFMPEYYAFRRSGIIRLDSIVGCNAHELIQDICFAGCHHFTSKADYDDYHKAFSILISGKTMSDVNDPIAMTKFEEDRSRWKTISEQGYTADTEIHDRIVEASVIENSREYSDFVKESFTVYDVKTP